MTKTSRFTLKKPRGFTLIEVLVAISIMSLLLGLLMAGIQKVREAAARAKCQNQLKQIALGLHHYHLTHNAFPLGWGQNGSSRMFASGWGLHLLPFIEQSAVWSRAGEDYSSQSSPWGGGNHPGLSTPIPTFQCPSDPRVHQIQFSYREQYWVALTSYLGVCGTNNTQRDGVLVAYHPTAYPRGVSLIGISDGTSQTLLLGERPPSADFQYGWWYAGMGLDRFGAAEMILGVREYRPNPIPWGYPCPLGPNNFHPTFFDDICGLLHFWSPHSNGGNFAFADGAVKFLTYGIDPLMPALATRAGGEPPSDF